MSPAPPASDAASGAASSPGGTGSFSLPGKNVELRRKENEELHGKDLLLRAHYGDGKVHEMRVKESSEAGYVKLLLAKEISADPRKMQLFFNGKQLIDPMSLCDHKDVKPPTVDIEVRLAA